MCKVPPERWEFRIPWLSAGGQRQGTYVSPNPPAEEALRDFLTGVFPTLWLLSEILRRSVSSTSFWPWLDSSWKSFCLHELTYKNFHCNISIRERFSALPACFPPRHHTCFDTSRSLYSKNASSTFYQFVCDGSPSCKPNNGSFWCYHCRIGGNIFFRKEITSIWAFHAKPSRCKVLSTPWAPHPPLLRASSSWLAHTLNKSPSHRELLLLQSTATQPIQHLILAM